MPLPCPSPYELKKLLMLPRKLYMRRRENLEPGFMRSALELHYYRPAFYQWLAARSRDEHLLHTADLDEHSVVLDVGAYIGEWAQEMQQRYRCTIHAFEPEPRNYRQLEKRTAGDTHIHAYSYGLGERNETVRMSLEFLGSTAFGKIEGKQGVDWEEAEIRDVAALWPELGLQTVDMMKVNIEGGEFPLFERMIECNLLERVDTYLIQFHEWHPGAYSRRRKIHKALAQTHQLEWDYHFVWEKWVRRQ
ncbi:MAG: FkbM family methyltransferase [Halioglobus sp.]|nr:FkbM family methyltransferase [Halioglobus sp.]